MNDTLGHTAGDELLVDIASRLREITNPQDLLARLNGDEFALLITSCNIQSELTELMEGICESFKEGFMLREISIHISFSIGVSVYPTDGSSVEELLKNADNAMYKAKEYGKNNYQFFNELMNRELTRKITIEGLLKKAIANNELSLHYQPQYHLDNGVLCGFEALLRWHNPQLGSVRPLEFIPIAEESGQIIAIGEWVIQQACEMCKKMLDTSKMDLIIAVNVSPIQFKSTQLVRVIQEAITTSGILPRHLEIEITEGVFIENHEHVIDILNQIRDLGVGIALDDFGTGYSSLSYLKKLPIGRLKIDKSFIDDIDVEYQKELIESIILLAHKLNIECIAEGVETQVQGEWLRHVSCDKVQGYFFNVPLTEVDALALLTEKTQFSPN